MKNLGDVNQFSELAAIYHGVVNCPAGTPIPVGRGALVRVSRFQNKRLNYLDFEGRRYVQQNPNTSSVYAAEARQGSKIIWIIRLLDNVYLGRIQDGTVYLKEGATKAVAS